jgi:hypothetical protein
MWPSPDTVDANPEEGFSLYAFRGGSGAPDEEFQVLLNGAPWEPGAREGDRSDPLEPNTRYDVEVQLFGAPAYTASFTTGAARPLPESLPAPAIASVTTTTFGDTPAEGPYTRECGQLFFDSGCYDWFPIDIVVAELVADPTRPWRDDALFFHTRNIADPSDEFPRKQTFFPGSVCGPIVAHGPLQYDERPCVQVRYQVPDGRYSEWSEMVCAEDWGGRPDPEVADAGQPDASGELTSDSGPSSPANGNDASTDPENGCTTATAGRSSAVAWLTLGALALFRRRTGQRAG